MIQIFFDSSCSFCQQVVRSLKAKDKKKILSFTPIQESDLPKKYLEKKMFVVRDKKVFLIKSNAYLYIYKKLGGYNAVMAFVGRTVPHFIRDNLYGIISARRHWL